MRGSQEDIGDMLVNLGASRTNSVTLYSGKTQDICVLVFAFRDGDALLSGCF